MPRPTKFTVAEARILRAARVGMPRRRVALAAGIHHDTLYEWLKTKPDFSAALEKAEASGEETRLHRIEQAAKKGEWQADAWWLERRYPDEWGRRERHDVTMSGSLDMRQVVRNTQAALDAVLPQDPELRRKFAEKLIELGGATAEDTPQ